MRSTGRKPIVARAGSKSVEDSDGDCEVTLDTFSVRWEENKEHFCFPSRRSLNTCREARHLDTGEVETPSQTSGWVRQANG